MDVEGVHTMEAPCKRVHSPMEDSSSPSWTYIPLDSSPQVANFAKAGLYNPSWTCMP